MGLLFFWRSWLKDYRWIWHLCAATFILSLCFLWYSYFQGASGVISWIKLQEQKVIETTVHSFRLGPFNLSIPADSYAILEYFHGSDIEPNVTASYLLLAVLAITGVIIIAVVTTLEKFWYFIGMALFLLFIVSLRLEVIGIFGIYNKIPVAIIILLFTIPSFYFNRIKNNYPFLKRLLVFAALTVLLIIVIAFFSAVQYPFYHLTLTGYLPGLIVSVIFIVTVAHEVLAAFIYIVSQGTSKSLQHFGLISVIYMANVIITCFHELGIIEWNFLYINLYLLLTISAILGIWGFRQREILYENIVAYAPFGAYFFLAIGAICFATIGSLLGNANDPALKIIRDVIIFSHTGYGIIFLTYVFSNFILMMARNLPVYKVLYNPTRMPYFTYRFAGLIAVLGFVFYSNWRDYVNHGTAGFYNYAGDLHTLLGNSDNAINFYRQAASLGFQNNRANYAMATSKSSRFNLEAAREDYSQANARRPTKYSLTNAGNIYVWEGDVFNAIRSYKHANELLNGSNVIDNNLGFAYTKVHDLDSALLYLNRARNHAYTKTSAETNFFALAALELIPIKIDSVLGLFETNATPVIGNALVVSTLQHQELKTEVNPLAIKKLNLYSATLLNNYCIKYATTLDTTFVSEAFRIASDPVNADYSESLKASLAFAYYFQGNVTKALEILAELAYISQDYQGKFNYLMGLWALEQENPELASSYFTHATTSNYKEAGFYNAIALSEARKTGEALIAWDTVLRRNNAEQQAIAVQMKKILSLTVNSARNLNDAERYQFCRYRLGVGDSLIFNRLVQAFESADYKAQAILDFSKKCYDADQLAPAIKYFNRIAGLELTDERLFNDVRHFELLMLASSGDLQNLARQINTGITFDRSRTLEKSLYTALIAESSGDTLTAKQNYEILSRYNPYLEDGVIAAANFYRGQKSSGLKSYNILAEAIQINTNSLRLLKAYAAEATRSGFDEYAASVANRILELEQNLR
jgi:tetratricopeptide (TPR) repeat protein